MTSKNQFLSRIKNTKILLIIPFIAFFILLYLVFAPVTEKDIRKYANEKNSAKLILFIKENYTKKDKEILVKLAIEESINKNVKDTEDYLKNLFFQDIHSIQAEKIIHAFNKENKLIGKEVEILPLYINETKNSNLEKELTIMSKKFSKANLYSYFSQEIKASMSSKNYDKALEVSDRFLKLTDYNENQILSVMERIKSIKDKVLENNTNIKTIDDKISDINSKITSFENDISNLRDEITKLQNIIKEANEYLQINPYFTVNAYVIAELDVSNENTLYEIAFSYYRHAYLIRKEGKIFTTKGFFSLPCKKSQNETLKSKTTWDIFEELTSEEKEMNFTMEMLVINNKSKVYEKEKEISSKEQNMSVLKLDIKPLENKKTILENYIKLLEKLDVFSNEPIL